MTSERRIQLHSISSFLQLLLPSLQSDVRILMEAEAMFTECHQVVFEGCFENTNGSQMVSCFSNEVRHRLSFKTHSIT
jgi:hypothetical protein